MNIVIAECKQEISSFNPLPSTRDAFAFSYGQEILDYHRGIRSEVGGALSVFDSTAGVQLIPTFSARMNTSGGVLRAADFDQIAREFLDPLRAAKDVDAVYFSLHGAMASEVIHDTEGYLLEQTRRIFGEKVPIVASLDLHGILTDTMIASADALVPFHTYPHVDFFQTGERAARLLLRIMAKEVHPVAVRVSIPALVRGDELITETGLFGKMTKAAENLERSGKALAAGVFIGNPFTDVPDLCSNAFVITDGDESSAKEEALRLAKDFWEVHDQLQSKLTGLTESIDLALSTKGHVVLVDAADAPSSGASGDSNAILAALAKAASERTVLAPIVDAPLVSAAFTAGIGGTVRGTVGGSVDPKRFPPMPIQANVRMLSDGHFSSESHGEQWFAGRTAVLEWGRVTLVVTSLPCNLWDRSLFLANGQNPAHFDMVIVKSPHCQHHFFAAQAERLINVDAPGATTANIPNLGHTRCPRPIFPLDPDVTFEPIAKIFAKGAGK